MTRRIQRTSLCALIFLWATPVIGQTTKPTTRATPTTSASQPAKLTPNQDVAVSVNGHPIIESDIETLFQAAVKGQSRGREPSAMQLFQMRQRYRPHLLNALIDNSLIDKDLDRAGIAVTDKELADEMEKDLQAHLVRSALTREEFEKRLQAGTGMSLKAFTASRITDPAYGPRIRQKRLLEKRFPDDVKVTDAEVKEYYEKNLEKVFKKPSQVQASHILIDTTKLKTDQAKQSARKKIEEILAEAKKPGADFGALARKYSEDPSVKNNSGDLGFFPREDAMVEPFAAAAFDLKTGEISNIVETRYGYHIIKATGKKESTTITLDQATSSIRRALGSGKVQQLRQKRLTELKKNANIVYPKGKEPAQMPTTQSSNTSKRRIRLQQKKPTTTRPIAAGRIAKTRPSTRPK